MVKVAGGLGPILDPQNAKSGLRVGPPSWYTKPMFTVGDFAVSAGVKVGSAGWVLPKGAKYVRDGDGKTQVVVVLLARGSIHVLAEQGELYGVPNTVLDDLRRRHFKGR